jgi:hypothetical protein
VHVAVVGPRGPVVQSLLLTGDRAQVRAATVAAALALLAGTVDTPVQPRA